MENLGKNTVDAVPQEMRLNKYISDAGFCSRREADRLIEAGEIFVNGKKAQMGLKVTSEDVVTVSGKMIRPGKTEDKIIYAFYKPAGVTSTMAEDDPASIYNFLKKSEIRKRVYPVGRLDMESSGLILLTNDGELMNQILKTSNNHQKEYVVKVNKDITPEFMEGMGKGVIITDGNTGKKVVTRKCHVKQNGKKTFNITLMQGLNRQIRRMCGAFGYEVKELKRIRIMNIHLDGLKEGEIRVITEEENRTLRELCQKNSKVRLANGKE